MTTEIILLRHGETDWNATGRIQGHGGPGLNEVGRAQAQDAAQTLISQPIDLIYSSDLARARETAEIIGEMLGVPVILDERLRERGHGDYQGYTTAELNEQFPGWRDGWDVNKIDAKAPNGESAREVLLRLAPALDEIASKHSGRRVLVVSHGGAINIAWVFAEGRPHEEAWNRKTVNCDQVAIKWPPPQSPEAWLVAQGNAA